MSERGILHIAIDNIEGDIEAAKNKIVEYFHAAGAQATVTIKKAEEFVAAASDSRVVNNTENAVRHAYRVLSDEEKALMVEVKDKGAEFLALLEKIGGSPELTIAKRKIQEATFWAVHHVTR